MSRKKLSEFRAKTLIFKALGQEYTGVQLDSESGWQDVIQQLPDDQSYVVKVDQAEKGRFKKGLVKLDRRKHDLAEDAQEIFDKGYRFVLVEEYKTHETPEEKYLLIERLREGNKISFSNHGGVDIEDHSQDIQSQMYDDSGIEGLEVPNEVIKTINQLFNDNYLSFLEINPFTIKEGSLQILDAAAEVDDEASFFEDGWQISDIRKPKRAISEEELTVYELSENSQASFSLECINPDGSIWLLLSGGGASVVVADEVHNLGYGKQLGNYGEYSGNPNTEETRHYTDQLLKLMLKSQAQEKVLIIGGGVANFTDVRQTFKGVIEALEMHLNELKAQNCAIYVRRGGPHEKEGLEIIKAYLDKAGIKNEVAGPELILSDIVELGIKELAK